MKEIPLTQGKTALVDDEDYDELSRYNWFYQGKYAARHTKIADNSKKKIIYMHHAIVGQKTGLEVDHVSGQRLDNRKENLRHVTHAQNLYNKGLRVKETSSQFKGVGWSKHFEKWRARIIINRKDIHLGLFDIEKDAATAYNNAATELYGEYARLNVIR